MSMRKPGSWSLSIEVAAIVSRLTKFTIQPNFLGELTALNSDWWKFFRGNLKLSCLKDLIVQLLPV